MSPLHSPHCKYYKTLVIVLQNVSSSVHGHWLLARAKSLFPETQLARNVSTVFDQQFTEEKARMLVALGRIIRCCSGWRGVGLLPAGVRRLI